MMFTYSKVLSVLVSNSLEGKYLRIITKYLLCTGHMGF